MRACVESAPLLATTPGQSDPTAKNRLAMATPRAPDASRARRDQVMLRILPVDPEAFLRKASEEDRERDAGDDPDREHRPPERIAPVHERAAARPQECVDDGAG